MKIDKAVIGIGLIMAGILASYFYFYQNSTNQIQRDPKYQEVATKVGPQFDKITKYLDHLENAYPSAANIPKREVRNAGTFQAGDFRFKVANISDYRGELGYCLVAEHIQNKGRAYHSSELVNDPTWHGNRSYYHYVTGKEPIADLDGPCNETIIMRSRKR